MACWTWKAKDVDPTQSYHLQLCQEAGGFRYYSLREEGTASDKPEEVIAETQIVPTQLLRDRSPAAVAEQVRLMSGERFWTDAHGEWYTQQEYDAIMRTRERGKKGLLPLPEDERLMDKQNVFKRPTEGGQRTSPRGM